MVAEIFDELEHVTPDGSLFDTHYNMASILEDKKANKMKKEIKRQPKKKKPSNEMFKTKKDIVIKTENDENIHIDMHGQLESISLGENNGNLTCKICQKTFSRPNHLNRHLKEVHSDGPKFSCLNCHVQFKRKDALKRHEKQNTDESGNLTCKKPSNPTVGEDNPSPSLKCDICLKVFSAQTHLRRHKKEVHSDARPFTCLVCNASFKRMNSLKKHLKYHTDEGGNINLDNSNKITNCRCDKCDKTFQKNEFWVKHMRQVRQI